LAISRIDCIGKTCAQACAGLDAQSVAGCGGANFIDRVNLRFAVAAHHARALPGHHDMKRFLPLCLAFLAAHLIFIGASLALATFN
jgi:hypothetical protein